MTPILCEQLADERFGPGFDAYLAQRAGAARADVAPLRAKGDAAVALIAEFWARFYEEARADFAARDGGLLPALSAVSPTSGRSR